MEQYHELENEIQDIKIFYSFILDKAMDLPNTNSTESVLSKATMRRECSSLKFQEIIILCFVCLSAGEGGEPGRGEREERCGGQGRGGVGGDGLTLDLRERELA
jgi:hypothetical protein